MNIKISADSTCDLSPELVERYRIGIAPLYIVRDGESLVDGVDITPDEIYDQGRQHVLHGGGVGVRL
jgi:fatty acid-binding protein DegV